jgi:hypothetical protein
LCGVGDPVDCTRAPFGARAFRISHAIEKIIRKQQAPTGTKENYSQSLYLLLCTSFYGQQLNDQSRIGNLDWTKRDTAISNNLSNKFVTNRSISMEGTV